MVNDQPINPTEETKLDSLMRMMMEQMNRLESLQEGRRSDKEERRQDKEDLNKKLESLQEGRKEDKEDLNKKLEKLDQNSE